MPVELYSRTFEYHCITEDYCHCDWRVTLRDCVEAKAMTGVYIGNIAICAFVFVIGTGLLVHRIFVKGHRLFDAASSKGCLRPKPIDCMLFSLMIFNLLRLLTSVILIADIADDMISRQFMFEFPWQFGYGAFALYLIGIAQTLADSHKAISTGWLPSPRVVDFIGSTFFLAPFIMNNIVAIIGGVYARSNLGVAEAMVRVLYVFWFLHCFLLGLAVLFAGMRLIRILNRHLSKFQASGPRFASVKTGIFKIRAVMCIISTCLIMFAIFLLMYGALRDQIMVNIPGSIFLGVIWNYLGPCATLCVEIAIIFNPRIGTDGIGNLKSSSGGEKTTTQEETQSSSYAAAAAADTSFQATLSHHAFEDLKQQQMQYQQVFQKHSNRHHGSNGLNGNGSSTDLSSDKTLTGSNIPMDELYYGNAPNLGLSPANRHQDSKPVWTPHVEKEPEDPQDDLSSQIRLIHHSR
ncbi:hypothetical protein BDB00DRAFT_801225 [Zychaea mexicana]|uniref:uncharacterized protein n=1 Tax=Zychaea mexicana TaxID=64656 RepID=UPI0022FE1ACA|nr:uncharacterized protein BDB00DRAFT_801225 [Zychaea mexicana]KAI9498121.1 hypothetical protein BDB00DRAFT_801225 [Zychaea mexicana]